MSPSLTSSPLRSIASDVGTAPIAVSTALPRPSQRSRIHLSTRRLSPKPGQRKRPASLVRNQFTRNTFGGLASPAPISSQCRK